MAWCRLFDCYTHGCRDAALALASARPVAPPIDVRPPLQQAQPHSAVTSRGPLKFQSQRLCPDFVQPGILSRLRATRILNSLGIAFDTGEAGTSGGDSGWTSPGTARSRVPGASIFAGTWEGSVLSPILVESRDEVALDKANGHG